MASLGRAAEPTLSRLWAQFTGNATIGAAVIVSTQPENLTELIGDKINAAITETNWMDLIPFNEAVRLHGEYTACLDSQLH